MSPPRLSSLFVALGVGLALLSTSSAFVQPRTIRGTIAQVASTSPSRITIQTTPQGNGRIGILVDTTATPPVIVVIDGSPAAQAGLMTGDKLIDVDGQPARAEPIRPGPVGASTELTIRRGKQTRKYAVTRVDSPSIPLDTVTYPYPPQRVWQAVADLITSSEPMFPSARGRRDLPFSRLYNLKGAGRELGILSFETLLIGGSEWTDFRDVDAHFGKDGLDQVFELPKGSLMPLAIWHAVKITPSIRGLDKSTATTIRISITAEAFNNINGWNRLKSRGVIEGGTFLALLRRIM